ncbi:hypothetical protein [Desulfovibrio ferrophilus]|uniref:Uncharacterized protein n=1 Tax=Desulfovibrio ferrophilus TaxID=241368 RepID=A0A2Z6AZ59_9BACT|nr:hypothetical protein [Desulfovibrio ferrophilus]BBD08529.1 uncharacterized protein DFE_1803 [Desulfovibrio ferrophilus]
MKTITALTLAILLLAAAPAFALVSMDTPASAPANAPEQSVETSPPSSDEAAPSAQGSQGQTAPGKQSSGTIIYKPATKGQPGTIRSAPVSQ